MPCLHALREHQLVSDVCVYGLSAFLCVALIRLPTQFRTQWDGVWDKNAFYSNCVCVCACVYGKLFHTKIRTKISARANYWRFLHSIESILLKIAHTMRVRVIARINNYNVVIDEEFQELIETKSMFFSWHIFSWPMTNNHAVFTFQNHCQCIEWRRTNRFTLNVFFIPFCRCPIAIRNSHHIE